MLYFDDVTVLSQGPKIPARLLHRIGIFDQSVCWGIELCDPRDIEQGLPHLLISPIHPDSWPFVFHLKLLIRHDVGSLAKVADILALNKVNVLFAQAGPAGHHHASLTIVGEALAIKRSLKDNKDAFDRKTGSQKEAAAFGFCNELAEKMFEFIADLKQKIRNEHEAHQEVLDFERRFSECSKQGGEIFHVPALPDGLPKDVGILHHRIFKQWNALYDLSVFETESAKAEARAHLPNAISCEWAEDLAYFYAHGREPGSPMKFRYSIESKLLGAEKGGQYEKLIECCNPPSIGVASFDGTNHYLRIMLFDRAHSSRFVDRVKFDYSVDYSGEQNNTIGLLAAACKQFEREDVNLLRISNGIVNIDRRGEEGAIAFVAEAKKLDIRPDSRRARLRRNLEAVHWPEDKESAGGKGDSAPRSKKTSAAQLRPKNIEVQPHRTKRVFISSPFDMEKDPVQLEKNILGTLESVANQEGWDIVQAKTFADDATANILRKIQDSEAFLQIAFLRKGQDPASADFAFLHYEYGLAVGLGKPSVRLVDSHFQPVSYWKVKLRENPAHDLKEFDHEWELADVFLRAFRELEQKVQG